MTQVMWVFLVLEVACTVALVALPRLAARSSSGRQAGGLAVICIVGCVAAIALLKIFLRSFNEPTLINHPLYKLLYGLEVGMLVFGAATAVLSVKIAKRNEQRAS